MQIGDLEKFRLDNKTALITGAAGLLGQEHAIALLESGANLVLTDINLEKLKQVKNLLKPIQNNSKIHTHFLDITSIDSVVNLNRSLINESIHIEILINNAAINPQVKEESLIEFSRLENFQTSQWDIEMSVGLKGAFNCSKVFGTNMAESNGGVIVNIASDLSIISPNQDLYKRSNLEDTNQPVKPITYSVIKHGLIGMTKYIATYWSKQGVRCNAISPGGILNNQGDEFIDKVNKLIPLGRMANKDEYRGAIQFLCSDASSYMNGHNLIIDGGRSIW